MEIRPLDVHDDTALARFHEICDRSERFERPWEHMWSLAEMADELRHADEAERAEAYAAYDGTEMVGASLVFLPLLDNTDKVWAMVHVEPERRRRGIGSALVDDLVDRAVAEGRTTITGESSYDFERRDTHPTLRWARKNGFEVANTEIHRVLELPVADALLAEVADASAPHHPAYRIETYVDDVPDRYLESYCHLLNQLAVEAPAGDFDWEAEAVTPEIHLQRTARTKALGRSRYISLGVTEDDTVVAHSDLVLALGDPTRANQWGTLVRRDHRGHRLGAAVKVANLRALQADHPERREVHTTNAEVNAAMVAINDRLGFRPVAVCPGFQRRL